MTKIRMMALASVALLAAGCGEQSVNSREGIKSPAFMFWCFRDEVVSSDYHVPEMKTPTAATFLQNRIKSIPGYVSSRSDLQKQILTVSYESSTIRKMNFEEAIALSGFDVNGRPASLNAQIPEGVLE